MLAYLRFAAGMVVGSIVASGAWASSPQDSALNIPDDAFACSPPGVAATSPIIQDFAVLPVSDNAPVTGNGNAPAASDAKASESADQDSCCDCDDCCSPLWYGSAGVVFLRRSQPTAGTIIGAQPSGSPAFTRGSDFDFGWDAGPDITIGRRIGCDDYLEARYFNSYASADIQFVTPGSFIGAGFIGPGGITISGLDLTRLDSGEINWRRQQWDQFALLAGFRWVQLTDNATYKIGPTAVGDYNYINHLYGGQLGADWSLTNVCNPLQLNVASKAGIYGNAADGGITEIIGGSPVGSFAGQDTTAAFLGELDFSASYALTSHIAIRGGYQLLWLTDLALATDAASRSLLNPSLLRTVSSDGHLFYQGATVSVDFAW